MTIVEVEAGVAGTRINDGRCERQGRFVFGTMNEALGRALIGRFDRLARNLQLEELPLAPVAIANSICFSPDYVSSALVDLLEPERYAGGVSGMPVTAALGLPEVRFGARIGDDSAI